MKGSRIRLTEGDLRRIVRESVRRTLREMNDDDDASYWKGIDDYPDAPSADEQWKDYQNVQGIGDENYGLDKYRRSRDSFEKEPKYYPGTDYYLRHSSLNDFSKANTTNGMDAFDPDNMWTRSNQNYNGYKVDDVNNPSIEVWGKDVPAPELNEKRLSRIVRESVRKILDEYPI